ncbi:MAG: hypothetical protein OEZ06_16080 [Myxococcales bacterium]|nr:hypothetical protein [Myxococcales bacterium]
MRFEVVPGRLGCPLAWALPALLLTLSGCGELERGRPSDRPRDCDASAAAPDFGTRVHPLLLEACQGCHGGSGPTASSALVLGGDVDVDYGEIVKLIDTTAPAQSILLTKATASSHGGGTVFLVDSARYNTVLAWIEAGGLRRAERCGDQDAAADGGPGDAAADGGPGDAAPDAEPTDAGHDAGPKDAETDAALDATPGDAAPDAEPTDASHDAVIDGAPTPTFGDDIYAMLVDDCDVCHRAGGLAKDSALVLTGNAVADYDMVVALLDLSDAEASALLREAAGIEHGGGLRYASDSSQYAALRAWIEAGAPE